MEMRDIALGHFSDDRTALIIQARTKPEPATIDDDGEPIITPSAGRAVSGCLDGRRSFFADN
jgi:hypothetical protein